MNNIFDQYDKFIFVNGAYEKINETVDTELNDDSPNAVSNAAVTEKIDEIEQSIPDIVDNLVSTDSTKALSANQGRVLKEALDDVRPVAVIDNLVSTSATSALSANQGRVLNGMIGDIADVLDSINGEEI